MIIRRPEQNELARRVARPNATHPDVDYINITGLPGIGTIVQQQAARHHTPGVLELGGKSPHIVFVDADFNLALPAIIKAIIQNTAQTCSAGSR